MLYLAQQRLEKESPWKRDQLVKQIHGDPEVLALNCWAIACEQPVGAIPDIEMVLTPDEAVDSFRKAVKLEPARTALESYYRLINLPIPSAYLNGELPAEPDPDGDGLLEWVCGRRRLDPYQHTPTREIKR